MIERKILLAFIRVHILYHASYDNQGIHGAGMIAELASHGYSISPGTLYPILHQLNDHGLLNSETIIVNGKQRKQYTTTEKGKQTLYKLIDFIQELSNEVKTT
jgi:DNA-binding PadR family transcriptional regulator